MNDLSLFDVLGADLDPADPEPPQRLRHRVLAATRQPTRKAGLWRWSLATSAGLAAVLAVAIAVSGSHGTGPAADDGAGTAAPPRLDGPAVLLRAAQVANTGPGAIPRGDQFLYVETINHSVVFGVGADRRVEMTVKPPKMRQVWMSVDGTRDSLIRTSPAPEQTPGPSTEIPSPGCRNGKSVAVGPDAQLIPGKFESCTASPAYQPNLPIDPDAMLRYLRGLSNASPDAMFDAAYGLISEHYLTAAQWSVLFTALSRLPGTTVVEHAVDVAGRPGVAVSRTVRSPVPGAGVTSSETAQEQLLFDPQTFEFRGSLRTGVAGVPQTGHAVLKVTVVDQAGSV